MATTLAAGRTPPVRSVIVPLNEPVVCAAAGTASRTIAARHASALARNLIPPSRGSAEVATERFILVPLTEKCGLSNRIHRCHGLQNQPPACVWGFAAAKRLAM